MKEFHCQIKLKKQNSFFIVLIILYGSGREAQELKIIQWDIRACYKNIYSIMRKRVFQTRQSQMGDKKEDHLDKQNERIIFQVTKILEKSADFPLYIYLGFNFMNILYIMKRHFNGGKQANLRIPSPLIQR